MQINFEAAAIAQTAVELAKAGQTEHCRIVRRALPVFPATVRTQSWKSEALENILWTALVLSAIWALVVSVGF